VFDIVRGPAWPEGHDGRVVRNRLTDAWNDRRPREELDRAYRESDDGDYGVRPLWAGAGLDLVTAIETPQSIVDDMVTTAAQRIAAARHLLGD
jgi:nitronate monooxygenase